jgi:UDP-glucuronate 4-epimerase
MRFLITGGAGFIGSHTAQALIQRGEEVAIVDDLNDFYSPAVKEANLEQVRMTGPFRFYRADIRNEAEIAGIFESYRPQIVIHLAARAGVRPSLDQPLIYESTNVRGTTVLLEASRNCGVGKFLFASSSSIYGIENRVPFREDELVFAPISPYAATKIAGEMLCRTWSHLYGLQTICLRFFTVFGPRQRPDLAIHKFTSLIERGAPIQVFGDGTSARDYTYVDDTVSGILAASEYDCRFDVFNLGNSEPVALLPMIRTIERALGKKACLQMTSEQAGDVSITCADISKAQKLLGYCPKTSFHKGIERFVDWYAASREHSGHLAAAVPNGE